MTVHQRPKRSSSGRNQHGFSLVELMTVVLITGILAAIAIPTFSGYVFKSRTSEAVHFLGVIKLKQETYRSEFGRYAPPTGATPTTGADPTAMYRPSSEAVSTVPPRGVPPVVTDHELGDRSERLPVHGSV